MINYLVVYKDDLWFSLKVKSQPSLMQFLFFWLFGVNVLDVVAINTICGGGRSHVTLEDIVIVICFVSSKHNACTCFVPFGSQILSPPSSSRWTLV